MSSTLSPRIVLLGDGGVGKSCVVIQFVQNHFVSEYDPTIEQTFRKQMTVDDQTLLLDILDTAGQEEYSVMRDQYINSGQGFVLVYAITSQASFTSAQELYEHILSIKDHDLGFPLVLVGNKCDLEKGREVSTEEGEALAKKWRVPFYEASAKNRTNIEQVFISLVRQIQIRAGRGAAPDTSKPVRPTAVPSATPSKKKDSSLCVIL